MYNLSVGCGNTHVQTPQLMHPFVLHNMSVNKTLGLYQTFVGFIHKLLPPIMYSSNLLLRAYARNTQGLLLQLLIYLKKGY